jgi:hypothetical protein
MKILEIENKTGKVKLNEMVTRDSIGRMIDEIGKLFGATASASGADFGEIMNAAENAVDVLEIDTYTHEVALNGETIGARVKVDTLTDWLSTTKAPITAVPRTSAKSTCFLKRSTACTWTCKRSPSWMTRPVRRPCNLPLPGSNT